MFKKLVPYIFLLTALFVLAVPSVYFIRFPGGFSENQTDWASFGSYVGGTVGAVFASLSFLALLYTVYLQREELSTAVTALNKSAEAQVEQAKTYEIQKFETTFYSLLELHNQALQKLDTSTTVLSYLSNLKTQEKEISKYLDERQEHILKNTELSQYFRILYQLLKFIAKSNVMNRNKVFNTSYLADRSGITENEEFEKMYASFVRSFVPVNILPVLALNCIPSPTCIKNLDSYWHLLERYEFLEHLKIDQLPLNLSSLLILDRYSYALGDLERFKKKQLALKNKYPEYFDDKLMEGGILHTLQMNT